MCDGGDHISHIFFSEMSSAVPAVIKWGKERLSLSLTPGTPAPDLKREIFTLTRVPAERQKIMCPGWWKGALKDDACLPDSLAVKPGQSELTLMLMGTADEAPSGPIEPTVFAEDLSAEDVAKAEAAAHAEAAAKAEGMIAVLQMEPGLERSESKALSSNLPVKYNFFVHGLPQMQIEDTVRLRRQSGRLLGTCAMTLGQEVGKAYVNALACLGDGVTLASGLDNGRIQLWRHAHRLCEVAHEPALAMLGGPPEPITCLIALPTGDHGLAFASGAAGSVKLWTESGECAAGLPAPLGTAPVSMLAVPARQLALAVTFRQARPFDTNAFRLVPQDEEQRRRRAEAMAAQEAQRIVFEQLARCVTVVELAEHQGGAARSGGAPAPELRSRQLGPGGVGVVNALASLEPCAPLLSGDDAGRLHLWARGGVGGVDWHADGAIQLVRTDTDAEGRRRAPSVVCMEPLLRSGGALIAVSLAAGSAVAREAQQAVDVSGATVDDGADGHIAHLQVPAFADAHRGVILIDVAKRVVLAAFDAHGDTVHCMRALPDGSLATAGGMRDGKIHIWAQSQWGEASLTTIDGEGGEPGADATLTGGPAPGGDVRVPAPLVLREPSQTLHEPGYIFGMAVLPDAQPGSQLFAVACARYNVIKICL